MRTLKDLVGERFGRLTVVKHAGRGRNHHMWLCRCECGAERRVQALHLKSGHTRSCGCWSREQASATHRQHGLTRSAVYKAWDHMKGRCLNNNDPEYRNYGARGITVCARWLDFASFFQDMGHPQPGQSIERADNDAGYFPENCRWATQVEQARNRRTNRRITLDGTTLCLAEWAARKSMDPSTLWSRLRAGWPLAKALSQPIELHRRSREG